MLTALLLIVALSNVAQAHPLGNFTINHFARIEVGDRQVRLRFVVDMAEIPTFQELRAMTAGESAWTAPSATAMSSPNSASVGVNSFTLINSLKRSRS